MSKVAIATDSSSGLSMAQGKELGIFVLPMPFYVDEVVYYEDKTMSQDEFFQKLESGSSVATSQPSPGEVLDFWNEILKEYDEIVYIPLSSGLSSSLDTAVMLSDDYDGRVQVVNNQRVAGPLKSSVLEAYKMAENGKSAKEIREILEATRFDCDIYLAVDTLTYLKKGGRLTPAAAAIGTVLNLKPVLRIKGEKLDAFAKTRGLKAAKKTIIQSINDALAGEFADCGPKQIRMDVVYSGEEAGAREWLKEVQEAFPDYQVEFERLCLTVCCHTGPGVRAITIAKKVIPEE